MWEWGSVCVCVCVWHGKRDTGLLLLLLLLLLPLLVLLLPVLLRRLLLLNYSHVKSVKAYLANIKLRGPSVKQTTCMPQPTVKLLFWGGFWFFGDGFGQPAATACPTSNSASCHASTAPLCKPCKIEPAADTCSPVGMGGAQIYAPICPNAPTGDSPGEVDALCHNVCPNCPQ